jgi:gamma-glutamylputrescine oxidase
MNLLNINDTAGAYPPSYYARDIDPIPNAGPAQGDIHCDVCVIGGGFTGLSTALHLAKRGYTVRVLEAQRIGFGATGRNGGQVGQGQRLDQDTLEQMFGDARAKDLWTIGTQASALVRKLAQSDLVQADFHPGLLYVNHRARYDDDARAYAAKMNDTYDYDQMSFLNRDQVQDLVKSSAYFGGTYDTAGGHIDPLQFAFGLARMAQAAGAVLHENSQVTEIKHGSNVTVRTKEARIRAKYVVMCCNGYIGDLHDDVSRRVMPINNYIVATEPLTNAERAAVLTKNIAVADSKFVVNYYRFSDDNRMLFGGTESYGYRFPKDIARQVRKPMSKIFPQLKDVKIDYAWGGTLGITMNRMPHYATYGAGNVLSLSGFSGSGVAMGTLSGQIAAEMISGQAERFDIMANLPSPRFPGGPQMRHPLLILAMLWYGLRDRL